MAWPDNIETVSNDKTNESPMANDHPNHHNTLARLVNALQTELGTNPRGVSASVAARLGALQDAIDALPSSPDLSMLETKGDLIAALSNNTGDRVEIPTGGTNRAQLVTDSGEPTGWRVSVKSAPYNVMEAGAVGNGSTSDTAAINTALNAAAGNGPLLFPPGTYIIDGTGLRIPSNSQLVGMGWGRSILKAQNNLPSQEFIRNADFTNGNSNILFQNLEIDGNRSGRPVVEAGTADGSIVAAGHVTIRGTASNPARQIRVIDCYVHHCPGLGITAKYADGMLVQGCTVHDNVRDGININTQSRYGMIIGNRVYNCGDDQIAVHSTGGELSNDHVIMGNTVGPGGIATPGGGCITISGLQNTVIIGNTCLAGPNWGIGVWNADTASVQGLVIANNTIKDAGTITPVDGYGIKLEISTLGGYGDAGSADISDVLIDGNTIDRNRSHGIHVLGADRSGTIFNVVNLQIRNNMIRGRTSASGGLTGAHGINLERYCQVVRIAGNYIRNMNFRALNCQGAGIVGTYLDDNTIWNNCKSNSGAAAMRFGSAAGVQLRDNIVFDPGNTQGYAIDWATSTGHRMFNNDFTDSGTLGTFTGTFSGVQSHNVNNAGTLYYANATTVPYATGNMAP